MTDPVRPVAAREDAEVLAQRFHETYERLAPSFGYETRKASAKPWAEVPEQNRNLMIAVCAELLAAAPVPCAASPADLYGKLKSAFLEGFLAAEEMGMLGGNEAWRRSVTIEIARATGEGARDANVQLPDVRRTVEQREVHELRVEGTAPEVTALYDISAGRVVTCSCVMVTGGNRALNTTCPIHGKPETAPVAVSLDPHRLLQQVDDSALWKVLNEADDGKAHWSVNAWRQWFVQLIDAASELSCRLEDPDFVARLRSEE